MSIKYRFKRSSGPVHDPIPAHPDAFYRPQYRPTPANAPPIDSGVIAPRLLSNNPFVAAPLAAGEGGFSPWWIIGPLLALLALGALAYGIKKKQDSKKQAEDEKNSEKKDEDNYAERLPIENVTLSFAAKDGNKQPIDKSASLAHGILLTEDKSARTTSNTNNPLFHSPLTSTNDRSDLNTDKPELKDNRDQKGNQLKPFFSSLNELNKKENQPNDSEKAHTHKTLSGQSVIDDPKVANKSGDGGRKRVDSSEEHGLGKSPLVSSFPTGSKRGRKANSSSSPDLEQADSDKDDKKSINPFPASDLNKVKNPSSQPTGTGSSDTTISAKPTNENDFTTNPYSMFNQPDPDKSDLLNRNKTSSLMPNVPPCKTNTSSSEDDYDEIYPISLHDSSNPSNKNTSAIRKSRTLSTNKSPGKRFHPKDQV